MSRKVRRNGYIYMYMYPKLVSIPFKSTPRTPHYKHSVDKIVK